jgi:hypothetical protein
MGGPWPAGTRVDAGHGLLDTALLLANDREGGWDIAFYPTIAPPQLIQRCLCHLPCRRWHWILHAFDLWTHDEGWYLAAGRAAGGAVPTRVVRMRTCRRVAGGVAGCGILRLPCGLETGGLLLSCGARVPQRLLCRFRRLLRFWSNPMRGRGL